MKIHDIIKFPARSPQPSGLIARERLSQLFQPLAAVPPDQQGLQLATAIRTSVDRLELERALSKEAQRIKSLDRLVLSPEEAALVSAYKILKAEYGVSRRGFLRGATSFAAMSTLESSGLTRGFVSLATSAYARGRVIPHFWDAVSEKLSYGLTGHNSPFIIIRLESPPGDITDTTDTTDYYVSVHDFNNLSERLEPLAEELFRECGRDPRIISDFLPLLEGPLVFDFETVPYWDRWGELIREYRERLVRPCYEAIRMLPQFSWEDVINWKSQGLGVLVERRPSLLEELSAEDIKDLFECFASPRTQATADIEKSASRSEHEGLKFKIRWFDGQPVEIDPHDLYRLPYYLRAIMLSPSRSAA